MFSTARRTSRLLCIFICLALAVSVADAAEPDSDHDGLSDAQEIAVGLDPRSMDSNMDGISDPDAYRTMRKGVSGLAMLSTTAPAGPTNDADADGVRDFLETYGYYRQDNQLTGLNRIVSRADWDALAARGEVGGYKVYEWATTALTENLLARYDATRVAYIVDVAAAYPVIRAKFINRGIPEHSALITGSTAQTGSIAAIMAELVTDRAFQVPTDRLGKALPVYFTHPLRRSTDEDPYSDYEEAMGLGLAGTARSPADHPLVAALPAIRATLLDNKLTEIKSTAVTLGTRESVTSLENVTETHSHSHGFSASMNASHTWGKDNSVTFGVSASTSHEWSTAAAVQTGTQNAHETFAQNADTTSDNCFAKLGLTVQIENVGSDMASNISTSLEVYLGDTLWKTVPITYPGLSLPQQHSVTVTALGQGASYDSSCLTLKETNYLQQRGSIGIKTVLADANINAYDSSTGTIVQTGSWNAYRAKIESGLARIDLNVSTTTGTRIARSFWVVAAQDDYPNLGLSIETVLGRIYKRFTCSDKELDAIACFETDSGDIALTRTAAVDFSFYDESGQIRPRLDSYNRYLAMTGDNNQPLSKIPTRRTIVSIVQHASNIPVFLHAEVLSRLDSTVNSNGSTPASSSWVRALVRDFHGIDRVDFCVDENTCRPMTSTIGNAGHPTSGQYEIALGQYTFTGKERLRAKNVLEVEAELLPKAFFLTLGESLDNSLTQYAEKLAAKVEAISQLDKLRSQNFPEYERIIVSGLMADVDVAQEKGSPLEQLRTELTSAQNNCAHRASAKIDDAATLAKALDTCLKDIRTKLATAFNQDIPVYNPTKLPFSHVDGTEMGWDRTFNGGITSVTCQLQPGQFLVGVDLGKSNADKTPTAWLRYVTWDQYSGTLRPVQEMARCGPNTSKDNTYSTPNTYSSFRANLILDVGASIGGSKLTNQSNGQVTRLCVRYRTFNFQTLQFEDSSKIDCDGSTKLESTEASTGKLAVTSSTEPLFGLVIGGESNKTFTYMRGNHLKDLSRKYSYKPWHTLVSGGRYLIQNSALNTLLTLQGSTTSSRGLTVAAANGSANQVWIAEAVNDREFRLIPQSYKGFVTRSGPTGMMTAVNSPASNDSPTVNFLQHWRLEKLPNGAYLIESALDDKKVLAAATGLTLQAFSNGNAGQQWHFVRLDAPGSAELVPTQVKALTLSPNTALTQHDNFCTIVNSRDANGNPRYFNHLNLQLILPADLAAAASAGATPGRMKLSSKGEIFDDARRSLAMWYVAWPTSAAAYLPTQIEIQLQRSVPAKELRFCGGVASESERGYVRAPPNLQSAEVESLCKLNATDPGPVVEDCKLN